MLGRACRFGRCACLTQKTVKYIEARRSEEKVLSILSGIWSVSVNGF
jgi:hypothetical protein